MYVDVSLRGTGRATREVHPRTSSLIRGEISSWLTRQLLRWPLVDGPGHCQGGRLAAFMEPGREKVDCAMNLTSGLIGAKTTGGIGWLIWDNPSKLNALSPGMSEDALTV